MSDEYTTKIREDLHPRYEKLKKWMERDPESIIMVSMYADYDWQRPLYLTKFNDLGYHRFRCDCVYPFNEAVLNTELMFMDIKYFQKLDQSGLGHVDDFRGYTEESTYLF